MKLLPELIQLTRLLRNANDEILRHPRAGQEQDGRKFADKELSDAQAGLRAAFRSTINAALALGLSKSLYKPRYEEPG